MESRTIFALTITGIVGITALPNEHGIIGDHPHTEHQDQAPVLYRITSAYPGTASTAAQTMAGSYCAWLPRSGELIPLPSTIAKGAVDYAT